MQLFLWLKQITMRQFLFLLLALPVAGFAQLKTTRPAGGTPIKMNGPIQGRDLTVLINGMEYKNGVFQFSYSVRNTGTETVDLKEVVMQGNLLDNTGKLIRAAGATTLMYEGMLNPGQEYRGILGCNEEKVYKNWNYTYRLKVDEANKVAEINENNNIAEYTFTGIKDIMADVKPGTAGADKTNPMNLKGARVNYTAPPPTSAAAPPAQQAPPPAQPKPDLVITAGSMVRKSDGSYEVQFTIKNIGAGTATLTSNGIRMFGRVREAGGFERTASYPTVAYTPKTISPGETVRGSYIVAANAANSLTYGQAYEYYLTVDFIKDIDESNEANNEFRINIRAGY